MISFSAAFSLSSKASRAVEIIIIVVEWRIKRAHP
jgi:hypothetical protein